MGLKIFRLVWRMGTNNKEYVKGVSLLDVLKDYNDHYSHNEIIQAEVWDDCVNMSQSEIDFKLLNLNQ